MTQVEEILEIPKRGCFDERVYSIPSSFEQSFMVEEKKVSFKSIIGKKRTILRQLS